MKAEEDAEVEIFKNYGSDPRGMVSDLQREGMIAMLVAKYMQDVRTMQQQLAGEGGGGVDPVVQLKEKEIELRAQEMQSDAQVDQAKLQLDAQKLQQSSQEAQARIDSQEGIAQMRADVAKERVRVLDENMQRNRT